MHRQQTPHDEISWLELHVEHGGGIDPHAAKFVVVSDTLHQLALAVIGKSEVSHPVRVWNDPEATVLGGRSIDGYSNGDGVTNDVLILIVSLSKT